MKVLVTGGSGFLGKHVCEYFGADNFSRRVGFDVLDEEHVKVVSEYDLVIHLAAKMSKSHEDSDEVFRTNVQGTVNVLKNVKPDAAFVFASMREIYGSFADNFAEVAENCPIYYATQSPLEWSKLVAEHYVDYYAHNRGFRSCNFRMSTIIAPRSDGNTPNFVAGFARAIDMGEPIRLPINKNLKRDFLHVSDFSAACEAFGTSILRHGTYNLGGGAQNAATLTDLLTIMQEVSGLEAIIDTRLPLPMQSPSSYVTDLRRVTQEIDWRPKMSLKQSISTLFSNAQIDNEE